MAPRNRTPASLDSVFAAVERLSRNIESLDRSMQTLGQRLVPAVGEPGPRARPTYHRALRIPAASSPVDYELIFATLKQADDHLLSLEADFRSVRSKIDDLAAGGTALRDDIAPWIKRDKKER